MTSRPYFTLLQRNDDMTGPAWLIEFGAYDKSDVEFERDDFRDHGVKARDLKIIKTVDAKTSTIEAAVALANGMAS